MQTLIFGIVSGSILAIATVGFSMIRQTEGFLHIGHSQYLPLGAYLAYASMELLDLPILWAGVLAVLGGAALSTLLGLLLFQPLKHAGALPLLFTSIGTAFLLYGVIGATFGAGVKTFPVSLGTPHRFGPFTISIGELTLLGVAVGSVLLLQYILQKTRAGLWIRAVATNPDLAAARGVPIRRVSATVWAMSGGLAALAGVLVGVAGTINTQIGWSYVLLIIAAAVVGGLGSIYGVILAGLGLGIIMDLSTLVLPTAYRSAVAFGTLALVLILRPEGIFAISSRKQGA